MGKITKLIMRDIENTMGLEKYKQLKEDTKNFSMSDNNNIIRLSDVIATEIDWLWYPYIPRGKLTILQGDPGLGKTFIATELAARVSSGKAFPFCDDEREAILGNVVFQTADDGYDDTIKPRLLKAGADCSRVFAINEKGHRLSFGDTRLREVIWKYRPELVIIDPMTVYLDTDSNSGTDVYSLLTKLIDLAAEFGCAIVLIGHMNKAQGSKAIYRGLGSIAFMGAARSVLGVSEMPDSDNRRVLTQIKLNVEKKGPSIIFELDPDNGFSWVGLSDLTADELLDNQQTKRKEPTKQEQCCDFIRDILSDGPMYSTDVARAAIASGFSKITIIRARADMSDLGTYKENGKKGKQVIFLKDDESENDDEVDNRDKPA